MYPQNDTALSMGFRICLVRPLPRGRPPSHDKGVPLVKKLNYI